jgi:tetratricopeptide (TPR) repeat protein
MNRARADLFESMQVLTMAEAVQGQLELAEDRIQTLSNLGTALRYLGDVKAAEHMHRRALELGEKLFPPDHPSLARDLNGLAGDLRVRERLDEGREALVKARGIYERNYGPRHALVGRIASNLALFERLGGDEAAAQELFQEAYRIVSEALGDDHLFTREVRMMARLRPSAAGGGQEKDAASS